MSVVYFEGGNLLPTGNKGDELMLRVATAKLRAILPHYSPAVAPGVTPFEGRCQLGLRQLLWPKNPFRLSGNIGYFVLNRYRQQLGLVSEDDISAVVNFQGYRYADMGAAETALDAKMARARSRRKVKHIFLPQAFGPFSSQALQQDARQLFRGASLLFARDPYSQKHVMELLGSEAKIAVFPDITIGTPGEPSDRLLPKDFVAVVPNYWMLHRGGNEAKSTYLDFLKHSIEISSRQGFEIVILNHSPDLDSQIVKQLLKFSGETSIQSIEETNALQLKGIIAKAHYLIGSRYHAIVGALSQNVPAIGTSWSEKYQGLYADFGADDLLVTPSKQASDTTKLIEKVAAGSERDRLVARLDEANQRMREQLDEMWTLVGDCLASSS